MRQTQFWLLDGFQFSTLLLFLDLDAHCRDRSVLEPFVADGLTTFLAEVVLTVIHSDECVFDLFEKFPITVPKASGECRFAVFVAVIDVVAHQVVATFAAVSEVEVDDFLEPDSFFFKNSTKFLPLCFR